MIQCDGLSDRMPEVALGRSTWGADEQAHLDSCPDCQAEWRLVQTTSRLGASLSPLRSPEVMTAGILGRLSGERAAARSRRWTSMAAGLAAAAAIVIAVRGSRTPSSVPAPGTSLPVATAPRTPAPAPIVATEQQSVSLPELDGLPDGELQAILGSLDESNTFAPALDGSGLDDMDDHELEDVLGAWEG